MTHVVHCQGAINTAITRAHRHISLLREYRARLIADVVTGKLDVRDVELPAVDHALAETFQGLEDADSPPDDAPDADDSSAEIDEAEGE